MIDRPVKVRATYDRDADAAYIYLSAPDAETLGPMHAVPVDPSEIDGMVNLDIDPEGRLAGIEILDASKLLSPYLLAELASDADS